MLFLIFTKSQSVFNGSVIDKKNCSNFLQNQFSFGKHKVVVVSRGYCPEMSFYSEYLKASVNSKKRRRNGN